MNYILETARLRLREFTLEDTNFILELLNSEGWLKFIGDRHVHTVEAAKAYLENGPLKSYADHGYGLSLVEMKANGLPIGMCGILNRDTLDNPDIGFAFLPDFGGQGYALEIVQATLVYAKNTLELPTLSAITLPDNLKSIRLLKKVGLTYHKTFCLANSDEELLLYTT
jgi:RimJ/RimL family protein N-acetyltransferase